MNYFSYYTYTMDFAKIFNFIAPQQRKRSYSFRAETSQDMRYLGIALGELFSEFAKVRKSFSIGLNGDPSTGKSTIALALFLEISVQEGGVSSLPVDIILKKNSRKVVSCRNSISSEFQVRLYDLRAQPRTFFEDGSFKVFLDEIPKRERSGIDIIEHSNLYNSVVCSDQKPEKPRVTIKIKKEGFFANETAARIVTIDFDADIMNIPYMDEVFLPATRFLRLKYDADKDVHLNTAVPVPLQLQANTFILDYAA